MALSQPGRVWWRREDVEALHIFDFKPWPERLAEPSRRMIVHRKCLPAKSSGRNVPSQPAKRCPEIQFRQAGNGFPQA